MRLIFAHSSPLWWRMDILTGDRMNDETDKYTELLLVLGQVLEQMDITDDTGGCNFCLGRASVFEGNYDIRHTADCLWARLVKLYGEVK